MEHFDVIIVGAGLSGIGAGAHLRMMCPGKSFAILEGRERSGGTWDLFRYPGVRSDSDMFTLGYRFKPWSDPKAIADAPAILKYVRKTAAEFDLEKEIRYNHRVTQAEWSSNESRWTLECSPFEEGVDAASAGGVVNRSAVGRPMQFTCSFLYLCTGYYRYENGYTPDWPDIDKFAGTIIHPQKWPEDFDYSDKNVLVIGSGATAVTLVPAMAETARHVTMLQRSPTYVVTMPSEDKIAKGFRRLLPPKAAYAATRWKNVLRQMFFYELSKKRPSMMKKIIAKGVKK